RPFVGKDVPLVSDSQRTALEKNYPPAASQKALALSPTGTGSYYRGNASSDEAIRRALEACGYTGGVPCIVLALDDSFVVPVPTGIKVTGFFVVANNAAVAPELRTNLAQRLGNAPNAWNGVAVGINGRTGLMLNAANEEEAIEAALADCSKQDRNCHV